MQFWMGVTDNDWFRALAIRKVDEVNFWRPSPNPPFRSLPVGTPFLFKLRAPNNHIAGGGFFTTFSTIPLSMAWAMFGTNNGAESLQELFTRVGRLAPAASRSLHMEIGCTILTNTFFFDEADWIPVSDIWRREVVVGKTFDTDSSDAQRIWAMVEERLQVNSVALSPRRYGREYLATARVGQGAFRVLVTDAYGRRCAITGESVLPTLEAAHILPYKDSGPSIIQNGLLLRADFHKLFDDGLVTVTPELKVKISKQIHEKWFNGKAYYALDGMRLSALPQSELDYPQREYLDWHYHERFEA